MFPSHLHPDLQAPFESSLDREDYVSNNKSNDDKDRPTWILPINNNGLIQQECTGTKGKEDCSSLWPLSLIETAWLSPAAQVSALLPFSFMPWGMVSVELTWYVGIA